MNYATDVSPIVFDLETCGLPNAEDFLEPIPDAVLDDWPVEADARLKDPVKIAENIDLKRLAQAGRNAAAVAKVEQTRAAREDKLALDWNVGRIAALGWWTEQDGIQARACPAEPYERNFLNEFWAAARHRTLVGFNIKGFDLRFLVQRSRYLGVPYPQLDFSKYSRKGIEDLYLMLTFGDGTYDQGAMRRTLHAFAKRFGIPVTDSIAGKEIPALVAAGKWEAVLSHVTSDVELTVALARRLEVI